MSLEVRDYIAGIALIGSGIAIYVSWLSWQLNYRPSIWLGRTKDATQLTMANLGNRALFLEAVYEGHLTPNTPIAEALHAIDLKIETIIEAGKKELLPITGHTFVDADFLVLHLRYRYGSDTRQQHHWYALLVQQDRHLPCLVYQGLDDPGPLMVDRTWLKGQLEAYPFRPQAVQGLLANLDYHLKPHEDETSPS